jgi:hypothetical protein
MARVAGWLGVALHLVVGVVPYAVSGLVAPAWVYPVLYLLWAALLVVAVRLARRGSGRALLVPVAAVVLWLAVISFGEAVLGWTA